MTNKFLVKLTPLEPYFFGDENTIRFDDTNRYFVTSLDTPSAMTIMGMLRYTILEQNGLLAPSGRYSPEAQQRNAQYIGSHSLDPTKAEQTFGKIQSVSPLFLMDPQGDILIKLPLNHKMRQPKKPDEPEAALAAVYTPMRMGSVQETSFGSLCLPEPGEFHAKETVRSCMYVRAKDGRILMSGDSIEENLFSTFVKVTNDNSKLQDGFVKKAMKRLKPGYSFAVLVELGEGCVLHDTVCYMGREKSAFSLTVEESGLDLDHEIRVGLGSRITQGFSYALSDLLLTRPPKYTAFAMTDVTNLRYLTTQAGSTRISQGPALYCVVRAGSVFYHEEDLQLTGGRQFGINHIITFGGNQT